MKNTFYELLDNTDNHTSYYGALTLFDFEGHQTMKSMADKISRDWSFDRWCQKQAEARDRMKGMQEPAFH